MRKTIAASFALSVMALPVMAAPLSEYSLFGSYRLSETREASGIAFDWDTGTLLAVGDEGESVDRYSLTGQYLDSMTLDHLGPRETRAADDPEGITYLGNGRIGIADERDMVVRLTTYEAGATRTLAELEPTSYSFGPGGTNSGLEGVAYDPIADVIWGVQELNPLALRNMPAEGGAYTNPFEQRIITRFNLHSISDIYVMANSQSFALDDPRRLNLLILGRDDQEILEINRAGQVVDRLDFSFLGLTTIEGLTMDNNGTLYLVGEAGPAEPSHMFALNAVPEPSTYALFGMAALGGLWLYRRRRRGELGSFRN